MPGDTTIAIHTYATSFLNISKKEGELVSVTKQVKEILTCSQANVLKTLNNKILKTPEKITFLESLLSKKIHPFIRNLLNILKKNDRSSLFLPVLQAFLVLESLEKGEVPIKFVSCKKLSKIEKADLVKQFSEKLGKKLLPRFFVDPSILGGLKVYLQGHLIDSSWSHRLSLLIQHMEGTTV